MINIVTIIVINIGTVIVASIHIVLSHVTCTHAFVLLYYWRFNT